MAIRPKFKTLWEKIKAVRTEDWIVAMTLILIFAYVVYFTPIAFAHILSECEAKLLGIGIGAFIVLITLFVKHSKFQFKFRLPKFKMRRK